MISMFIANASFVQICPNRYVLSTQAAKKRQAKRVGTRMAEDQPKDAVSPLRNLCLGASETASITFYKKCWMLFRAGKVDNALAFVVDEIDNLPSAAAFLIFSEILRFLGKTSIDEALQLCITTLERDIEIKTHLSTLDKLASFCVKHLRAFIRPSQSDGKQSVPVPTSSMRETVPRSSKMHSILLLIATRLLVLDFTQSNFSSYKLLMIILLKLGADINEKNHNGENTLAYTLRVSMSEDGPHEKRRHLVEFLLDNHARPAYATTDARFPPQGYGTCWEAEANILQSLRPYYPLPLLHQAALAVVKNRLQYEGLVPEIVAKFVDGFNPTWM